MAVLQKINDLKPLIVEIKKLATDVLPEEIVEEVLGSIDDVMQAINKTGTLIEKHFHDEGMLAKMQKSLSDQIAKHELYTPLSADLKKQIVEMVIENKDLEILSDESYRKYLQDYLQNLSDERLVKIAYNTNAIIQLGDAVIKTQATDTLKYEEGLHILEDIVKTPHGKEEALTEGMNNILRDPTLKRRYLLTYYGLAS